MVSRFSNVALLLATLRAPSPDAPLTEERVTEQLKQKSVGRRETFETLAAFYDAVLAEERHQALARQRQALAGLISMNERRFGEGVIAERDLIRARIEASRVDLQVSQARLALERALIRIGHMLDLKEDARAIRIDHDFDESPHPFNRERLRDVATKKHPPDGGDRNAWLSDIEATAAAYEISREQIQSIRLRLLQRVEESYSIERLLYEQMKTDLITLLEAGRVQTEVHLSYNSALHQAATSRLRLGYLLGEDGLP